MSRRSLRNMVAKFRDERSSLGDTHVDTAIGKLNAIAMTTAGLMCHYSPTREATLPMLFHDTDLEKLRQVRGLVDTRPQKAYDLGDVTLSIDYDEALVPSIEAKGLHLQRDRMAPLLTFISEVKAIHDRFEEVKGVLKWMNRNMTPGAIRYYFPAAMKLCPKSPIWEDLQEVPSRYTTPDRIHEWLQAIKDASATVAGAQMLPADAKPTERKNMWLTFPNKRVDLGLSSYTTDSMTYNL